MRILICVFLCHLSFLSADFTFTTAVQVNPSTGPTFDNSLLTVNAINENGDKVIAWHTAANGSNIYVSILKKSSDQWSKTTQVNATSGGSFNISSQASVAINNSGKIIVSWQTSSGDIFAAIGDTDNVWLPEQKITTDSFSTDVSSNLAVVALNNSDKSLIIWDGTDRSNSNNANIYSSTLQKQGTWSSPQRVNTVGGTSENKSSRGQIGISDSGVIIAAWQYDESDFPNIIQDVYTSTLQNNGKWGSEVHLNTGVTEGKGLQPQIAISKNGKALISWRVALSLLAHGYYTSFRKDNGNWSDEIPATSSLDANSFGLKQSAINDNGVAFFAWVKLTDTIRNIGNVFVTKGSINGWDKSIQVSSKDGPRAGTGSYPNVGIDSDGNCVATWFSSSALETPEVFINTFTNDTWGSESKISNSPSSLEYLPLPTISMNPSGACVISWFTEASFSDAGGNVFSVHSPDTPAVNKAQALFDLSQTVSPTSIQIGPL